MKLKLTLIGLAAASIYTLPACDKHDHDHPHDADGGHSHKDGHGHDHGKDGDGHAHAHSKKAGPNGGRVLHDFEPHVEFLVLKDRKVQITFVDDDNKPIPAGEQVAFVIAGDRAAPTELSFTKKGDVLVSDKALPASDNFPVVVQIAAKAGEAPTNAKFQVNMHDHGEGDDHGHDH